MTAGKVALITGGSTGIGATVATQLAELDVQVAICDVNADSKLRINVICPGVVDTAIVPDDYKKPEFGMMPTSVMAAEIVDLLQNGKNGEVRVKVNAERAAFRIEPQDLSE